MYANGTGIAFRTFRETVKRLNKGFSDQIRWMKLSEIARYWAAKELTAIARNDKGTVELKAPFATPGFTLEFSSTKDGSPRVKHGDGEVELKKVSQVTLLKAGTWVKVGDKTVACFDLEKGKTTIV